ASLPNLLKGRSHILAARVARMEGNWDVVREEVSQAINAGIPTNDAQRLLPRLTIEKLDAGQGELQLRRLLGGRSVSKLKPGQQRVALDIAVRYGFSDVASEAIQGMALAFRTGKLAPQPLFDAAIAASGVANDEAMLAAFDGLREQRGMRCASTYYYA